MDKPIRKNLRLSGYDYSRGGAYFVTVVAANREAIFGTIEDGQMCNSSIGNVVAACWIALQGRYDGVRIEDYVVMPNHLHGIVTLNGEAASLGIVVGSFKSGAARMIRALPEFNVTEVWQRGFHDHIIRDDADRTRICEYIQNNPARWREDKYSGM